MTRGREREIMIRVRACERERFEEGECFYLFEE